MGTIFSSSSSSCSENKGERKFECPSRIQAKPLLENISMICGVEWSIWVHDSGFRSRSLRKDLRAAAAAQNSVCFPIKLIARTHTQNRIDQANHAELRIIKKKGFIDKILDFFLDFHFFPLVFSFFFCLNQTRLLLIIARWAFPFQFLSCTMVLGGQIGKVGQHGAVQPSRTAVTARILVTPVIAKCAGTFSR